MNTITIEVPDYAVLPFAHWDEQFARELRLAAAIFWYEQNLRFLRVLLFQPNFRIFWPPAFLDSLFNP